MARPQKRTVDYFPHYVNNGKTLLILQNEFGNDGYAFWFKLLSLLCKTDGQVYDYNNYAEWRLLLAETNVSEDNCDKLLQLLSDLGAIDKDLYLQKIIWVQNLIDNLADVYRRRGDGSIPEKPVIVNKNPVNVDRNPQTKLNKTKLNKTKLNKTKLKSMYGQFQNVLLTDEEYAKLREKFNSSLDDMIERLSEGIASKGYKYKSHYATILSWDRKDKKESGKQGDTHGSNKYSEYD